MGKRREVMGGIFLALIFTAGGVGSASVSSGPSMPTAGDSTDDPLYGIPQKSTLGESAFDRKEKTPAGFVLPGTNSAKDKISDHFTIHVEDGVDVQKLAMKIVVPLSLQTDVFQPDGDIYTDSFADQLDLLYLVVGKILDIQLKHFKIEVRICKDAESLERISEQLFGTRIQPGGFFVVSLNTLYVDAENVTLNILGHELAHAIQAHYFGVPPPERIQEILSAFVEYELRKYSN